MLWHYGGPQRANGEPAMAERKIAPIDRRTDWRPDTWRRFPAGQQAEYPHPGALEQVLAKIAGLPPLVTSREVVALKRQIAEAAAGRRFVLQGGDCAESFDECEPAIISNRLKVLLQMSLVLVHGLRRRVVRIGRFAGQYAKPRSSDTETRGDIVLPAYRGDLVNGIEFTEAARTPDPERLLRGHSRSAMTINFVRALIDGGFADLHHPEFWDLDWVQYSPHAAEYQRVVDSIGDSLRFMETLAGQTVGELDRVDFYTSHEALHLYYEQAHTRQVPRQPGWFNLSTHFPWIGMRTADVDGAHVEYFRGIENPIGIKVGPGMTPEWLTELLQVLDPDQEPGRITLIHRMGADAIAEHLPQLIEAMQRAERTVLWSCDPMHGNTEKTASGVKTRKFGNILSELEQAFDIHARMDSHLGGVHFELTGENVTECMGGARDLNEADLARCYKSQVDPRLNYEQSLEMALRIVRKHREVVSSK